MKTYETKTNRKKLINAFSDSSPVISMYYLTENEDFVATSNISKILLFNSSLVPLKSTRTTQGVQVLLSKKGSTMEKMERLSSSGIINEKYYRNKHIPAVGYYAKEGTVQDKQIDLSMLADRR
jgi:DNA gyrase subunit A